MESQETVINKVTKSALHKNYKVITEHEVRVLEAVRLKNGVRFLAAEELEMTERAVIALLSRVRLKLEGAGKAKRKYGKILQRKPRRKRG